MIWRKLFYFPSQLVKDIFKKYSIEKVEIYHVLTDTDSTALQFIIVSDPNSDVSESKFRDIIFEVIVATKIYKRFDTSQEFWDNFNARKISRQKSLVIMKLKVSITLVMLPLLLTKNIFLSFSKIKTRIKT